MHQGDPRQGAAASGSGGVPATEPGAARQGVAAVSFADRLVGVDAAEGVLAGIEQVLHQCQGRELGPAFGRLDALARRVEAAKVAVLAEALERGEVSSTCASAAGWVLEWAPSYRCGGAGDLVKVDACGSGTVLGTGTTPGDGTLLAPETVRRIACDAALIPVVLGTQGEVLDLGRSRRLFTPAQLRYLWLRDGGCTIPGCNAPPWWCDGHHVTHWANGGATDVSNAALVCGRHHTIVHQRGWTATVTATGVTWHT